MDQLWLGYDGLSLSYDQIAAVLIYQPALHGRIVQSYGRVPANILAIVVTDRGEYLPSSWSVQHLRQRLARWRSAARN
ncbi:MAG: hypothetical protein H7Z42_19565 [Roseiflexaceae bacterium]|nr:hypothetical protein [Roseiflexaceae bacterium]